MSPSRTKRSWIIFACWAGLVLFLRWTSPLLEVKSQRPSSSSLTSVSATVAVQRSRYVALWRPSMAHGAAMCCGAAPEASAPSLIVIGCPGAAGDSSSCRPRPSLPALQCLFQPSQQWPRGVTRPQGVAGLRRSLPISSAIGPGRAACLVGGRRAKLFRSVAAMTSSVGLLARAGPPQRLSDQPTRRHLCGQQWSSQMGRDEQQSAALSDDGWAAAARSHHAA